MTNLPYMSTSPYIGPIIALAILTSPVWIILGSVLIQGAFELLRQGFMGIVRALEEKWQRAGASRLNAVESDLYRASVDARIVGEKVIPTAVVVGHTNYGHVLLIGQYRFNISETLYHLIRFDNEEELIKLLEIEKARQVEALHAQIHTRTLQSLSRQPQAA